MLLASRGGCLLACTGRTQNTACRKAFGARSSTPKTPQVETLSCHLSIRSQQVTYRTVRLEGIGVLRGSECEVCILLHYQTSDYCFRLRLVSGNWEGGDINDPAHGCPSCIIPNERAVEYRRWYYAAVTWSDHVIGQALALLEELGEANNTIVVFHSDHGCK